MRAACALSLVLTNPSHAAFLSYDLTLTNDTTGNIPSGTPYVRVTIDDEGATGLINFTVDILPSILTSNAGTNFGLQSFGFNVVTPGAATSLTASNIVNLPNTDWSSTVDFTPPASGGTAQDGFGKFDAVVYDGGQSRISPTLEFSIDLGGNQSMTDSILDYIAMSSTGFYFAAHITGFNDLNPLDPLDPPDSEGLCQVDIEGNYTPECNILTSVWVGADELIPPSEIPVPAAVWLFGSGLLGMIGIGRRKRTARNQ